MSVLRRHKMFWILVALSVPIVALAIVAVVGTFLPEDFSGRAEAVFAQPPEAVFTALMDFEKHPVSSHMAKKVERIADEGGLPAWREALDSSVVTVRTVALDRPRLLVRELEDSVVPMSARWTIELAPVAGGTRVTVVQTGTVESGTWHVPFFRFILRVVGGASMGPRAFLGALETDLGVAGVR